MPQLVVPENPDPERAPLGKIATEVRQTTEPQRRRSMLETLLIVVLVLVLIGAIPTWPHSRSWGYMPSGVLGVLLVVVLVLLLLGHI